MGIYSRSRIYRGIEVNTQKMQMAKTPEEKAHWAKFVSMWKSRSKTY